VLRHIRQRASAKTIIISWYEGREEAGDAGDQAWLCQTEEEPSIKLRVTSCRAKRRCQGWSVEFPGRVFGGWDHTDRRPYLKGSRELRRSAGEKPAPSSAVQNNV